MTTRMITRTSVVRYWRSVRLAVLLTLAIFITAHAPWRLMVLTGLVLTTPATMVMVTEDTDRYWDAVNLEYRLVRFGWSVTYLDINAHYGVEAYGLTRVDTRSIYVDESLRWSARYHVLAHEAGHAFQSAAMTGGQREAFAETVAALVTKENMKEHARYLARMRGDYLLLIATEWRQLYRVAALLQ